ncbi:MAG: DUF1854 domain-containing protein [Armatimonadetes bacterium]|nr:DUF1854 domain-containing protein [Armatimonadota bacterium]
MNLFYEPKDRLRLTVGDRSWHTVVPTWASPLTYPGKYVSLLDGKNQEIALVPELSQLSKESREALEEELRRRYLTAQIEKIEFARTEWGATYWTVTTNRGRREFVTQSLSENAQWLGPGHILLTDVDGNKFELRDVEALDPSSREMLGRIL